jgi:hypothetical protein
MIRDSRCDALIEGFSHFVTSMTAPIASGWSGCRVGLPHHWKAQDAARSFPESLRHNSTRITKS